jgi:hypothetical protein
MSIANDRKVNSGEKATFVYKHMKGYSDTNPKEKLWYEVYESGAMKWRELPAEEKSEKGMLISWLILLGILLVMLIYWAEAYIL